ncbi:ABC-three component system protein [Actinotignum sp. UMB0459]|uniref:ABC-three component system protein n=1 Tax=Actinotignum sp. UMB0459 TaxID=3449314 RepID=UPI003F7585B9
MIDAAWKDWYRAKHDYNCRASGEAFENYVTAILSRLHEVFINPDPMGSHGDGGCDGIADNGSILYACYGQRATTNMDHKTQVKLESDFTRALKTWGDFTTWRFVTNAKFGPLATKSLVNLQRQYAHHPHRSIKLEVWNTDVLWRKAVNLLTPAHLDEVIPGVPHAQNVELADMVELINSLEGVDINTPDRVETLRPVPATKMDYNNLPEITRAEFYEGRLLSHRIDRWFSEQAEPELRDEKARRFRLIYEDARQTTDDVREIIRRIYGALGGQDFDISTKRANAVYAVTAYFFDSCDIFEEPPGAYNGGDMSDAASH